VFPLACWGWLKVDVRLLPTGLYSCPRALSPIGSLYIGRRKPVAGLLLCGHGPRGAGSAKHFEVTSSLSIGRHSLAS